MLRSLVGYEMCIRDSCLTFFYIFYLLDVNTFVLSNLVIHSLQLSRILDDFLLGIADLVLLTLNLQLHAFNG